MTGARKISPGPIFREEVGMATGILTRNISGESSDTGDKQDKGP